MSSLIAFLRYASTEAGYIVAAHNNFPGGPGSGFLGRVVNPVRCAGRDRRTCRRRVDDPSEVERRDGDPSGVERHEDGAVVQGTAAEQLRGEFDAFKREVLSLFREFIESQSGRNEVADPVNNSNNNSNINVASLSLNNNCNAPIPATNNTSSSVPSQRDSNIHVERRQRSSPDAAASAAGVRYVSTESRLPQFWRTVPEQWFDVVEHYFSSRGISSDEDKYFTVVGGLGADILREVSDTIRTLPTLNRFSRWPEAVPLRDMSAPTVARAFFDNWVSRFGAPLRITTDQGRQFEGGVFRGLVNILGAQHIHTTPYHPAGNGMIERWHRRLKSSLMAAVDRSDWSLALPSVLLGLRVAIVCESDSSPAQMIYGNALRIPGDLCVSSEPTIDRREFHNELRGYLNSVSAVPTRPTDSRKAFVFRELKNCSHVLRATPKNKASLVPPFTGPHRVIKRQKDLKYFLIDYNGKEITVSAESVKPAFMVQEDVPPSDPPVPVCVERLKADQTSSGGEVPLPPSVLTPTRRDVNSKVLDNVPIVSPSPPTVTPAVAKPLPRVKFVPNILRRRKIE
ncbi:unnamed protein product [Trichogramma brassicae]|uniref:Integrase catalytic domain-containing protein n=1 Tax=Trichogramma brassicae TaxID=86971 RepID=A0A6H5IAM8_9HYME|nr:unnamed protein product [Trichogramma brassicae]